MALAANALATVQNAQELLGYTAEDQARVESLINMASARIESYCRRKLAARAWTLTLDGSGTSVLVLPHRPLNSVTHLYQDAARVFGAETEIAAASFGLLKDAGMIRLYDGTFHAGADTVKAECSAGYAEGEPEREILATACLELVKWMDSRFHGFIGKRAETGADGMNIGFEIELPLNVRSLLEPFVEVSV